jgi:uncharacterized membrane protein YsdA (DUF1294 family)/cold shock CspA family protein
MRFDGVIRTWDDERGFGFIEPLRGGDEIYVHITAFPRGQVRPRVKQRVSFEVDLSHDGRKRAKEVRIVEALRPARTAAPGRVSRPSAASLLAILLFAALLVASTLTWRVPPAVAIGYATLSLLSVGAYALDKASARRRRLRIPENLLHLLGLAGGWPGSLVAQQLLRHKSAKRSFIVVLWITVVLNVAGFVYLSSPLGPGWHWAGVGRAAVAPGPLSLATSRP